ncbi:DoxX family protein [Variovorax terrae]|uniref:DoxX family protein n=1 Tax=Variovorax terrae TaxID=2923278 RepID=A0A9X2ALZ2_9BURK|nr:DoxX family protein [Variovorax terrae]MCJ0762784.1 DoxX family protein [Variovorax terrae]
MLNSLQNPLSFIGRLLVAILFVPAGFGKIAGFTGTVGYIASKGLPLPQLGAVIAILVELGVGLLFLVGFKTRWSALALALFTLAAGLFFHNYWAVPAEQVMMQQINFYKNLAIAGGLLSFVAWGGGAWSLDARLKS